MKFFATLLACALGAVGAAHAADVPKATAAPPAEARSDDPGKLVQAVAEGMLKDLDQDREGYRKDTNKLNALIEKHLLPVFDTPRVARAVLGTHWTKATQEQRDRFVAAFYHAMLKRYGPYLADFTSDRMTIVRATLDSANNTAIVNTTIRRDNGEKIPVDYRMGKTAEGWKAFDVAIQGISYVTTFRQDFRAEIDQKGLEAVIQRIEREGVSTPAKKG